ncbi:MAG: alpha-glucuronidase family glycosyl hydrolase [Mucilaginibacter sp.]
MPALAQKEDNGYRLWLKYDKIEDENYLEVCRGQIKTINISGDNPILLTAQKELKTGLDGLLKVDLRIKVSSIAIEGSVIAGTPASNTLFKSKMFAAGLKGLPKDSYLIKTVKSGSGTYTVVAANNDAGVLYGVFNLLRLLQTHAPLQHINVVGSPKIQWRTLDHWDNPDGTIERGYAGKSLWKWDELPDAIDTRYTDYARANASIGINAVVLNNVNASSQMLDKVYLEKVAVLANVFRAYGIRVLLSANVAAPKSLGKLSTADPLDAGVQQWWKNKIADIYRLIPDFGGFLVKANSEGQPGPKDYGRTHADGANMLADALAPYNGVVMWRAFVYSVDSTDRARQAYNEFAGLDGKFRKNVLLQIKNGPLDFQPREPFSPLFGAMPNTTQMMELQITQEYTGYANHLVYLAMLFKEALDTDTHAKGGGSTIGKVIDGSLQGQRITGIAGVANTGADTNWTRHPFAQANWYAFGRLAWDHDLTAKQIAIEWINSTLTNDTAAVRIILSMMMPSREALVNYETPLGLTVLCGLHDVPAPWTRMYYHRADSVGLGFNRTTTGSNAVAQYFKPLQDTLNNIETCPENLLAWFHHVPWDHRMQSGREFWDELCFKYYSGVDHVRTMQDNWSTLSGKIDKTTFDKVTQLLIKQEDEAVWWRDACLWYFAKYSRKPIPQQYEAPRYPNGRKKAD